MKDNPWKPVRGRFWRRRRTTRAAALGMLVTLLWVGLPGPVRAADPVTVSGREIVVVGTSMTVNARVAAPAGAWTTHAGFCVRDASGGNRDYAHQAFWIPAGGVAMTRTAQFSTGTYRVWTCARVDGRWYDLDTPVTVSIPGPTTPSTGGGGTTAAPSGVAAPLGNLPQWRQVFVDDFTTPVARGAFPGPYASRWLSYHGFPDTRRGGDYNQGIIAVANGALEMNLHSVNGRAQVAAPVPLVNGRWGGQTYGKFSVRFKSDSLPGYHAAWLLWPDSENWNEGEIDFPEGDLGGQIEGYVHCIGNPSANCGWTHTGTPFTGWHTADIEWTPQRVTFTLDGRQVLTSTHVPHTPMHWVLQTESGSSRVDPAVAGKVQIDWVSIYTWTG